MQQLLFAANDGSIGFEYYLTDGVTVTLLGDLNPGPNSSYQFNDDFAQIGAEFVFAADNGQAGVELYKSDGTTAGTSLVEDIFFGPSGSFPITLETSGNITFFAAITGAEGDELWSTTDATVAGTNIVRDIFPGGSSSSPSNLEDFNGGLIFTANDGVSGTELWFSNGTALGTQIIKDINPGAGSSNPGPISDDGGNQIGNLLYFAADDGTNGDELWVTDGTEAGTRLVRNINPGAGSDSNPGNFRAFNDLMYFTADDGTNGEELWVTNGTNGGTQIIKDINPFGDSSPEFLTVLGNRLIFAADDGSTGNELWVSDGNPGGTTLLRDINGGPGDSDPTQFIQLGDILLFAANDGSTGRELYRTDGTVAGTGLLVDIEVGNGSSSPSDFTLVGDKVFFSAFTSTNGTELWMTDGTLAGTMRVTDIDPGTDSSNPDLIGVVNFAAANTAPVNLALSSNVIAENTANGTIIGALSATDADGDALTFTLTDNGGGRFAISGSNLVVAGPLDFETQASIPITAQADDGKGGTVTNTFTVQVTDVNEGGAGGTQNGTTGNDTFQNTSGPDLVFGNGGTDVIVYNVPRAVLEDSLLPDGRVQITDPFTNTVDTLTDIEIVRMNDGDYRFDLLEGKTVNVTATGLQDNLEFVYRLYAASLGRTPGADGLEGWLDRLLDGRQTRDSLADAFVLSAEFQNKFAGLTTPEAIVTQYFREILDREPAPAGLDFWVGRFNAGADLSDLLTSFAVSPEFVNNNADNYDDGVFVTRGTPLQSNSQEAPGLDDLPGADLVADALEFLDLG